MGRRSRKAENALRKAIRAELANGVGTRLIARKLGCSRGMVMQMKHEVEQALLDSRTADSKDTSQ